MIILPRSEEIAVIATTKTMQELLEEIGTENALEIKNDLALITITPPKTMQKKIVPNQLLHKIENKIEGLLYYPTHSVVLVQEKNAPNVYEKISNAVKPSRTEST